MGRRGGGQGEAPRVRATHSKALSGREHRLQRPPVVVVARSLDFITSGIFDKYQPEMTDF
jgi:hypothetical protein